MYFNLLGTAAGGGVPQWNCACQYCVAARLSTGHVHARLQLQAAVSAVGQSWYLINASPDLRFQIESNPELQPSVKNGIRNSPVVGIVLTSADLDQVLGLLLLREFQPLTIYTTRTVRHVLESNSFFRMLERVPGQLTWFEIDPSVSFELGNSGIKCTPIVLPGVLPHYARELDRGLPGDANLGLIIEHEKTRIAYTPSLPGITRELIDIYNSCDHIFVDGTFWSDSELRRTHEGTPLARSIGHVPIGGLDGTLALLASVTRPHRTFIHINNTNPILDETSAEHAQVLASGWEIGHDQWHLQPQPQHKTISGA